MPLQTEADVKALRLEPGKTDQIFWADRGFGVRLRQRGEGTSTTFVFQYKIGQKSRRVIIGEWPAMRFKAAQDRAEGLRGQLADAKLGRGIDPGSERDKIRAESKPKVQAKTIGALVDEYLAAKGDQIRARHLVEVTRHLKENWKALHSLSPDEVTGDLVSERLDEIAKGSGPVAANRSRASLSAFFRWAMRRGRAAHNPIVSTDKKAETSRERVLSDEELAKVWLACPESDYGRIVRLLMLTGQRRDEIGSLRWSEVIDGDEPVISLPGVRTKNKRPHDVPLTPKASAILKAIPHRANRDLVFGEGDEGFSGWSRAKRVLDKTAKLKEPWVVHDLRRTAATRMSDLGVQPHIVEAVLNHVSGHKAGVAGIYNRSAYKAEKRAALDLWANHLAVIVAKATGANVTRLHRA